MTRRNRTIAAAAVAVGGGTVAMRRRRGGRPAPVGAHGMCFRLASLAEQDAGRGAERVLL